MRRSIPLILLSFLFLPLTYSQVNCNDAPVALCDGYTQASLGSDGVARIHAIDLDDGSYDLCGPVTIKVARMVPGYCPPGIVDDTQFRDFVEVCCADVNNYVNVILRVWDNLGNYNDCWTQIYVEDKLPPVIHCPPDITVNCGYPYDLWDLSDFGTVVPDKSLRQPINIYSPPFHNGFVGYDGYAEDNCSDVWIDEWAFDDIHCNSGHIIRHFTATDAGWNSASCHQKITIKAPHPFNKWNIHWPPDVTLDQCGYTDVDPDITGVPWYDEVDCSLVAHSYKDDVFVFVEDVCIKILRHWTVIDWCQFNSHGGYGGHHKKKGIWHHTQVIKIFNHDPPEFFDCEDEYFCTTNVQGCKGYADFYPLAFDDCTPDSLLTYKFKVDLFNDGDYDISGTGNPSGYYPFGTHRIFIEANDRCLNKNTCVKLFTVEDCKKPTPVCLGTIHTVVMPTTGMLELNASIFNKSSFDNCTPAESLIYSYSTDITDTTRIFDCDDLGTNIVAVYVTDEAGNQQYCNPAILINDNSDTCQTGNLIGYLAGTLQTPTGEAVDDVMVSIESYFPTFPQSFMAYDGDYLFEHQYHMIDQMVEIEAISSENYSENVSLLDLILIQQHLTHAKTFEHPYQFIAADATGDHQVSVADMVDIKRLLLGEVEEFTGGVSYRFIVPQPDSMIKDMDDVIYTDTGYLHEEEMAYSTLHGLKIGDVSGVLNGVTAEPLEIGSRSFVTATLSASGDRGVEVVFEKPIQGVLFKTEAADDLTIESEVGMDISTTSGYNIILNAEPTEKELTFILSSASLTAEQLMKLLLNAKTEVVADNRNTNIEWRVLKADKPYILFPNPAAEHVFIHSEDEISHVELLSLSGKQLGARMERTGNQYQISLNHVTPGIYILQWMDSDGIIYRERITHF